MANDNIDFETHALAQRLNELDAAQAQEQANFAIYKSNYDTTGAAVSAQSLANIRAERANILQLHSEHERSKIPMQFAPETAAEKLAKPADKMTWQDAYDIARGSRHGVDDAAFQRGIQEVMRRRQAGE